MASCMVFMVMVASVLLAPQNYRQFKGQHKRFCGVVVETGTAFKRECDTVLAIGSPLSRWKIAAVIPKSARAAMPKRPEEYLHDEICFLGTVVEKNRKPYVLIEGTSQIEVIKAAEQKFAEGAVRYCDPDTILPTVVKEVRPEYTERAMRARVEGKVELEGVVDLDGRIREYRLLKILHPDLDGAAARAVLQWVFQPGQQFGKPVRMVVAIEMSFVLRR